MLLFLVHNFSDLPIETYCKLGFVSIMEMEELFSIMVKRPR